MSSLFNFVWLVESHGPDSHQKHVQKPPQQPPTIPLPLCVFAIKRENTLTFSNACFNSGNAYTVFMSFQTLEVQVENGRIAPQGSEPLPVWARALLTILETHPPEIPKVSSPSKAGLSRLLSSPDFPLTQAQFRTSMESDFWEQ